MRPISRIVAAIAAIALAAVLPGTARAGWWPVLKPDLKIVSIGLSPVSQKHVRVVFANKGYVTAPTNMYELKTQIFIEGSTTISLGFVPALAAGASITMDVYMGVPVWAFCTTTVGKVDAAGVVNELNESNNKFTFMAPPCQ